MPSTTPIKALPYPVTGDSDDVPRDVKALALAVDGLPGPVEAMTTTARNALTGAALYRGRTIYNTTNSQVEVYDGAAWGPFAPTAAPTTTLAYTAGVLTTVVELNTDGSTRATTTLTYTSQLLTQTVEVRGAKTTTTTLTYTAGALTGVAVS